MESSFKYFGPRYNLIDLFVLETHTNVFTHEMGFVMGDMLPCFTKGSNSALNLSHRDIGILCSRWMAGVLWDLCLSYIPSICILSHQIRQEGLLGFVPVVLGFVRAVIQLHFYCLVLADFSRIPLC